MKSRAELITGVKIKIDEQVPEDELTLVTSVNSSVNSINETIDSLINETAIELLLEAPFHLCPNKACTETVTVTDSVGKLNLPSDFLRFGYAKFTVWARMLFYPIMVGSKEYLVQQNEYSRGGYKKPVVALGKNTTGYYLEFYTIKEADKGSKEIVYIAKPTTGESITVNDILTTSLEWLLASKTLDIYGKKDEAKAAYEKHINILK